MVVETNSVILHPLVLLSVADHFQRSSKNGSERVVGTLLGYKTKKGVIEVTNSFAVPFKENLKMSPPSWELNEKYNARMYSMFLKVCAKEKLIGWYSTGPKIKSVDKDISAKFKKYCEDPILLVMDPSEKSTENLCRAFILECDSDHFDISHLPSSIKASDTEEIGIDQLLRDIRDKTITTESKEIESKKKAFEGLKGKMKIITDYLESIKNCELPKNEKILENIQEVFNDVNGAFKSSLFNKAFTKTSKDFASTTYVASMLKTILSILDLIENGEKNRSRAKKIIKEEIDEKENKDNQTPKKEINSESSESEDYEDFEDQIAEIEDMDLD